MRDDFGGLFAASPALLRRDPTPAEVAGGLACGAAGKDFWNENWFALSSVLAELNTILDTAGIAPDESLSNQLMGALAKVIPSQSKSIFNVARITTQNRVSMSAAASGALVDAITGYTYTKRSSTSLIIAWASFQAYSTSANGAITQRFGVGSGYDEAGTTSGLTLIGTSQPLQLASSPIFFISGVPSGVQSVTHKFKRDDNASWTTIFNPVASDVSGYRTPNTANYVLAEVES